MDNFAYEGEQSKQLVENHGSFWDCKAIRSFARRCIDLVTSNGKCGYCDSCIGGKTIGVGGSCFSLPEIEYTSEFSPVNRGNMTICIACICESGKKIVIASDRLLSVDRYEKEGGPKYFNISPAIVVMTAGNNEPHFEAELNKNKEKYASMSLGDIADELREIYLEIRDKDVETTVLRSRGLDRGWFETNLPTANSTAFSTMIQEMKAYNLNFFIILAGFDEYGGHIFQIEYPGEVHCLDETGAWAVGAGRHAAMGVLFPACSDDMPLEAALYLSYRSKKAAEFTEGVGKKTDLGVLSPEEPFRVLSPDEYSILEGSYVEGWEHYHKEISCIKEKITDKW